MTFQLVRCYPTPENMEQCFQWAFHLVHAVVELFGKDFVCSKMAQVTGKISTMFSGIDCAAHAWRMIQAAFLELYGVVVRTEHGSMAEIDRQCQLCLKKNFPGRCLFADVQQWVVAPATGVAHWSVPNIQLHQFASCLTHNKQCKLYEKAFMDVSGPPCVLWSRPLQSKLLLSVGHA